jgi:tRNA dimethylallyltransferase
VAAVPEAKPQATPPLVAVVGATGTGKSDGALDIAEALAAQGQPAEVVNADAMQLYRGMDIGTAKLSPNERRGISHHLLDVWEVTKEASVADYQAMARSTILEVQSRGVIPILVGGSGLYVSAVLFEFDFPGTDKEIRAKWEARWESEGSEALVAHLAELDPLAAAAIDPQNPRRLIRALEVIELTGKPFGAGLDAEHRPWQSNTVVAGLQMAREELVPRLNSRVDGMWEAGLVDEVRSLIPLGIESGVTASRAIGYAQALGVIHGSLTDEQAKEETRALTRRYARRQVSWFRRYDSILWCDVSNQNVVDTALPAIQRAL